MRHIVAGAMVLWVGMLAALPAGAQTANVTSSLSASLGTLDQTLDVAAQMEANGQISNPGAVNNTLEQIEGTLRNISNTLGAGTGTSGTGGAVIPTQFPSTGHYPD